MKAYFLNLSEPCKEELSNMTKHKSGFFCDLCSKNVIDITQMSPQEILDIINYSNTEICATVNPVQLQDPIAFSPSKNDHKIQYPKIAKHLLLASSLISIAPLVAQNSIQNHQTEIHSLIFHKDHTYIEQQLPKPMETKQIIGPVVNHINNKPLVN